MPTPSDIKNKARKVSETRSSFNNDIIRCQGQVNYSNTWWQGDAGKSMRSGYNTLQTEMNKLLRKLDSLASITGRLSDRVQQADDDRRAKADAAAKAQKMVSTNKK